MRILNETFGKEMNNRKQNNETDEKTDNKMDNKPVSCPGCNNDGYYPAAKEDGEEILKIMEEDAAPGDISLLYTRRDNPYTSFLMENKDAQVGVIKKNGRVVATIAAIPRNMYIGGVSKRVCYVTNMKRLKSCDAAINWYKMFEDMCRKVDCDVYYCSLIEDNTDVRRMLAKKRRFMPYTTPICTYKTYIISTKARLGADCAGYEFTRAGKADEADLLDFIKRCGRDRNFFPVFERLSDVGDIKAEDFYVLKRSGVITAAGAVWDRRNVKQYVLNRCRGIYALLRFINPVISALGYIKLPKDDTVVDLAFLSFLLSEDGDEEKYRIFISLLLREMSDKYPMLVIGTDINNPKYRVLEKIRSISFKTEINEVIMTGIDGKVPPSFDIGNVEVECALL